VFTGRYGLSPYMKQISFVFKGLMVVCSVFPGYQHSYVCCEHVALRVCNRSIIIMCCCGVIVIYALQRTANEVNWHCVYSIARATDCITGKTYLGFFSFVINY
jgi:hypothetical protein